MIAAIRIKGFIGTNKDQEARMDTLMLRGKYNCVILTAEDLPRINRVKELISFGEIDEEILKLLISKRGKKGKKLVSNAEEVVKELKNGKTLKELGITPYLRLHPPRGGFKKSMKLLYPRGILGNNKEISELIKRMV